MNNSIFEGLFHDPLYLEYKNHLYNYRMRRAAIRSKVDSTQTPILEIGSGVSPILSGSDEIIHSDISFQAMRHVLRGGSCKKAFVSEAERVPLVGGSIGTIICSEVLEHILNDEDAMREFHRVLRPGGQLILTVPVHPYFLGYDDRVAGHHRRYEVQTLIAALRQKGFDGFEVQTVAGIADKIGMLGAAMAYTLISNLRLYSKDSRSSETLFRLALPLFRILNQLYAGLARLEARIVPQSLATIILLTCKA